jgi:hypothetical protein
MTLSYLGPEIFGVFQKHLVENITHNQLPIIWQSYVYRPRNYQEAAEKASSQIIQRQPIVWKNRDELEFSWILMLKNIHIDCSGCHCTWCWHFFCKQINATRGTIRGHRKKVQEPLNTNDLIGQYMIKHNNTTYSGRIIDAGQSDFLETTKIPIEMLHFLRPGNFATARRRGPLRVRAPAPGGLRLSEVTGL